MTGQFFFWIGCLGIAIYSIYLIARKLSDRKPKLTQEEINQKFDEIAKASKKAREKKAFETAKRRNELALVPIEDDELEDSPTETKSIEWKIEILKQLDPQIFKQLCKEYLVCKSYDAKLTSIEAESAIDIKIYNGQKATTFVQCKAWTDKIDIKELNDFYEIMTSAEINQGIFFTTSSFTPDAIEFKQRKNITLINGEDLIGRIKELNSIEQEKLYLLATL